MKLKRFFKSSHQYKDNSVQIGKELKFLGYDEISKCL